MKKTAFVIGASALVTAPVQAAEWSDARPGAFVGARLTIGGKSNGRPSAALTIAPTQHRFSNGATSMKIGEGIAFNLSPGAKPTVTLAGIRADTALGLQRNGGVDTGNRLGIKTGGWIAIGLGVAAVAAGAYTFHVLKEADENSD